MNNELEKRLKAMRPRKMTKDERSMVWSNIQENVHAEQMITAHKQAGSFNIFKSMKRIRYIVAAVIAGTLVAGSFATAAFADNSRPGDLLFPVELAKENIQLRLASEDKRDELKIQFASERLEEVKELLALADIPYEMLEDSPVVAKASVQAEIQESNTGDTAETAEVAMMAAEPLEEVAPARTVANNIDRNAIVKANNAFLIALQYLEQSRQELEGGGNTAALTAIDAFIEELQFMAADHVDGIERARIVIDGDPDSADRVNIAIRSSVDSIKSEYRYQATRNNQGETTTQRISLENGDNEVSLRVNNGRTIYEVNNDDDDDGRREIEICYEGEDIEVDFRDLAEYLKDGAGLGECDDDEDDKDDRDDNGQDKVYVCHKGKTIGIAQPALNAHLNHGDTRGKCDDADDDDDDRVIRTPSCSLATDVDGRVLVDFDGERLRSDKDRDAAVSDEFDAELEPGTYRVTLMSFDGYRGRENVSQPEESWRVLLLDDDEDIVARTGVVRDLADNTEQDTIIEVVNAALDVDTAVEEVVALHNAYRDTGSPNSVQAICAAFDLIDEDADTTPPVITDIQTQASTDAVTVSWQTDELSTRSLWWGNDEDFATSSALGDLGSQTLRTSHSLTITGLSTDETYYIRIASTDAAGNISISGDIAVNTEPVADTTAPAFTGIAVNPATSSATVAWQTNEAATGTLYWSEVQPIDRSSADRITRNTFAASHSGVITGLSPDTTYYYEIEVADASGNATTSVIDTFTTDAITDTTAPTVSGITITPTTTEATIDFDTDELASYIVQFGAVSGSLDRQVESATLETTHSALLDTLTADTTYYFTITAIDDAGNAATTSEASFETTALPDTAAPIVSGINESVGSTTATVSFTTNEDATSILYYDSASGVDDTAAFASIITPTTNHSIDLTGLAASTTYYYFIEVSDNAGNTATTSEVSFTTN